MSTTPAAGKSTAGQSDLLLWVAGGVVAAIGIAWLLISQPWSSGPERSVAVSPSPPPAATTTVAMLDPPPADVDAADREDGVEGTLDNPLRMAQLAYEAGMLVEPEEYSAWTLYAQVVSNEPGNAVALEGLAKVADELIRRGETAWEQGRFDDARGSLERVLAKLPDHAAATALAARMRPIDSVRGPAAEAFRPEVTIEQEQPAVEPVPVVVQEAPAPARPTVDPIVEANKSFEAAMDASRLLTPGGQSAKDFVAILTELHPTHDLTRAARSRLSREFLSRADQSLEALDTEAAATWIDEAEILGVDSAGVLNARTKLTNELIAMESAKPLPASALKIVTYIDPEYPDRALERRIQGWVDVEFTVNTDGTTRNVTAAEASHENYFRREAVEAVEGWRFEPRIFMGRAIEQRSYTRIRFVQ